VVRVKDLIHRHIVAVSNRASVGSALRLMKQAHVSLIPVISDNRLVGILTKEEAEREEADKRLDEIRLELLFVEMDDGVEKAAKIMINKQINRLPVVNNSSEMKLTGIVTATEIVKIHKRGRS
jgi:CBS domain-containing protein